MAIPKAYQSENKKDEVKKENSSSQSPYAQSSYEAPIFTPSPSVYMYNKPQVDLPRKRKYLKYGLLYVVLFFVFKCVAMMSKWESDSYKLNAFGMSFSFGKKASAAGGGAEKDKQKDLTQAKVKDEKELKGNVKEAAESTGAIDNTLKGVDTKDSSASSKKEDKILFDPLSASSPKEVELLMKLAARRQDLDKREERIKERELALKVIEKQQNDKIGDLDKLKETIEGLLKKTDKTAQEKIVKLIKVYEGMKAKNVAHVFDRMDITILKDFIPLMNERKVSNILDQMSVVRAKELSMILLNDRNPFAASAAVPAKNKQ